MFRSLWARLLLAFILVLAVALGGMAFLAAQSTATEFSGYREQRSQLDYGRFQMVLSDYYSQNQGWSGVQSVVERLAQATGNHVFLTDTRGVVLADSEGRMIGQQAPRRPGPGGDPQRGPGAGGAPIIYQGSPVGTVHVDPGPPEAAFGAAFLTAVNRSIFLSAAAAAVVALALTLFISRRVLRPIGALTSAVHAMERGDLSQRVQVTSRDEVGELGSAFNAMAGSLARTEELRRNMVADVAHELRTPLSNVRGYLEAIRDGVLGPDKATLDSVYDEALHLSRLVDDLQEMALADAGQMKLHRVPSDLAEVVDRAVRAVAPQAIEKGIELSAAAPEKLPPVEIDQVRIAQVLLNLLSNALAHTPRGGSVTVRVAQAGKNAEVSVSDTGQGIAAEHLPNIFDRFYRADPSRARATGGSGIGLAVVRQLVEAHGGEVSVKSEMGRGSIFKFTLPLTVGAR